ncbi:hypothetical protein EJMOOK_11500 [Rhodanobacter sp. Root179]|uniref:hypothetical protein n=1 Tax=unclassified Rhodanobacter TaxID=2621553 RepID=UPI000AB8E03D|nr:MULTISPECIES: hypothetical protein [unclassified Rhodanobacter]
MLRAAGRADRGVSLYSLPSRLRCIHLGLVVIGASLIVQAFIRGECTEAALD